MNSEQKKKLEKIIKWMYFNFFRDYSFTIKSNIPWFHYLKTRGIQNNSEFAQDINESTTEFWKRLDNEDFIIVEQPGFGAKWIAIPTPYAKQILEFEEKILVLGGLP